jgi:hypothetical protein
MARDHKFLVIVSASERLRLAAAAAAAGLAFSTWVRHAALHAADPAQAPAVAPLSLPLSPPGARLVRPVHVLVTDADYDALHEQALARGMTLSAFVRRILRGLKPIARQSAVRAAIAAVNRAGVTLGPLVHSVAGGAAIPPELALAVADLRCEIWALRAALLAADSAGPSRPTA